MSEPMMHEPLSWLTLERYALGELSADERARVAARLAESEADRACLDSIVNDESELPELPRPALALVPKTRPKQLRWLGVSSALLAAAASLLFVWLSPEALPTSRRQVSNGVKGGEVAVVLIGEHGGAPLGDQPQKFARGERFKLLLTCPDWLATQLRVVVFQGRERYEPLARVPVFSCGNQVPWPGAFALDGSEPADVCVSFGATSELERASSPHELEPSVVCLRLLPR